MEPIRKITGEIPSDLYDELKDLDVNFDEVLNLALRDFLKYNKNKKQEEELRKGYEEMSEINLGLANMYLEADNEALELTERYLTECE